MVGVVPSADRRPAARIAGKPNGAGGPGFPRLPATAVERPAHEAIDERFGCPLVNESWRNSRPRSLCRHSLS